MKSEESPDFGEKCNNLQSFLVAELDIIKTHFERHKYFKGISDETEAMQSFLDAYSGIFRHLYCKYCCSNKSCTVWQNLI